MKAEIKMKAETSSKKFYTVGVRVVYVSYRVVQASSSEEAIKLAKSAEETHLEYSHTLDNSWAIEDTHGSTTYRTSL
jgi:hypothetical protein